MPLFAGESPSVTVGFYSSNMNNRVNVFRFSGMRTGYLCQVSEDDNLTNIHILNRNKENR